MKKHNLNEQNHETEERWAFIEKCSEEVKGWADWKKAEVYPNEFNSQKQETKVKSSNTSPNAQFD